METEFQNIRCSVKTVHDQTDRGGVHRNVGQISGDQEPSAHICGAFSEACLGECELTAGFRVSRNHVRIAHGDDHHDKTAHDHGNGGSGYAGVGKEFLAGIDEGTPADNASEGDCPHMHGTELAFQLTLLSVLIVFCAHF